MHLYTVVLMLLFIRCLVRIYTPFIMSLFITFFQRLLYCLLYYLLFIRFWQQFRALLVSYYLCLIFITGMRASAVGGGECCRQHPIPGSCFGFPAQHN